MNSLRARGAFTLRDLLVLMAVVGLAFAILLPWFSRPVISTPSKYCAYKMRDVGFAVIRYDEAKGQYPGIHESVVSANGQRFSRPLIYTILPQLERNDIFEHYDAAGHPQDGMPPFALDVLYCPSSGVTDNPARPSGVCSFVFNCGMSDTSWTRPGDWPANGVFHARYKLDSPYRPSEFVTFGSKFIESNDGLSNTIMVSESLDAGPWTDTSELTRGFVWSPFYEGQDFARINSGLNGEYRGTPHVNARLSSRHPEFVNVYFCDGHLQPIHEDIDYRVFAQLMTPAGKQAAWPGKWIGITFPVENAFRNNPVDDSDY